MKELFNINTYIKSLIAVCGVIMLLAPFTVSFYSNSSTVNTIAFVNVPTIITLDALAQAGTVTRPTSGYLVEAMQWVGNFLGNLLLTIASGFTYAGGVVLEKSLEEFVFKMGTHINTSGAGLGGSIDTSWRIIRDICNLVFIFGFIFVGIRTIIDPESASTKRFLTKIIIGALLINFSLFIVKAVVDFSNFSAYRVYIAMTGQGSATLSAMMGDVLGITSILKPPSSAQTLSNFTDWGAIWFYVLGALFLIVAAFVFAAAGILLVVRFVALVLIMIASPLLFAASVFPQTESYAKDIWKKLFHYAFFAPAFILLTLISVMVIRGLKGGISRGDNSFATALQNPNNGGPDSYGVIITFIVATFFLIQALVISQKLGIKGGEMAVKLGGTLRGKAQSFIGRSTVGWASNKGLKVYEKLDAKIANNKTASGIRKWGMRGLNVGTLGAAGAVLNDRSIRETLQAGEKAKFGGQYSYESDDKYAKERKARQAKITEMAELKKAISQGTNTGIAADQIAAERAVADANIKQLEELKQEDRKKIVGMMTQNQIDALDKSEKLTDQEKVELGKARQEQISLLYKDQKELLTKANSDQLVALGQKYFAAEENAVRLTSSQMDDLKKKFTQTEFKLLSDSRENALKKLASGGKIKTSEKTGEVELDYQFIIKQKPGEIAKMPASVLKIEELAVALPVTALTKIVQDGTLNKADQAEIRKHIMNASVLGTTGTRGLSEAEKDNITAIVDWTTDSPIGRQFGK